MAITLYAIRAIHNTFRKDIATIDAGVRSAAQGSTGLDLVAMIY
jgi:hypothetical protein